MQAVILSIGDELVLGQTVDTNSAYLSAKLAELGISTLKHETIADEQRLIAGALQRASELADVVLVSGGVGPTDDDVTREALADAMGQPLIRSEEAVADIEAFFAHRGKSMPERNEIQAMHPQTSQIIRNTCGTAPGIRADLARATIYVMPGVPREMKQMYRLSVEPELRAATEAPGHKRVILTTKLNTFGLGESSVAHKLGELMDRQRNPTVGTTVSDGIVSVRLRSEGTDPEQAMQALDQIIHDVETRLGHAVFGRDDRTLQEAVFDLLNQQGKTLATAESCTGGLIGKMMTDMPGCSEIYLGGWICYANAVKQALGVDAADLEIQGAVSEPVVRAMASGILSHIAADYSLAISGIAGPDGGTEGKPVGTVWVALGQRMVDGAIDTEAMRLSLPGDRASVRDRSAKCALQMLRLALLGQPLELGSWGSVAAKS